MRKYLIIYSLAFFIVGNVLFSSFHLLNEYDHNHNDYECIECLYFDNNNYILDDDLIYFFNNFFTIFIIEYYSFILNNIQHIYFIRPPPIFF